MDRDDPQTTKISRWTKCSNIPHSKILTPQAFVQVGRMILDRQHVEDWQKVTGRHHPSWTITSLATRYGSGILDNPRDVCMQLRDIYICFIWTYLCLLIALPHSQATDCLEADVGETWPWCLLQLFWSRGRSKWTSVYVTCIKYFFVFINKWFISHNYKVTGNSLGWES